jgi:hypothetical protein
MRTYDISPLWRSTIGFDRFFDLVDAAQHTAGDDNYPPCNVERLSDDRYQISLALAGFSPDEIAVTAEQNVLTVEGRKTDKGKREFLYLVATLQAAVQSGRLRPGQERAIRQWPAPSRVGSRDTGSHEGPADPDRQSGRVRRPTARAQGGLRAVISTGSAGPSSKRWRVAGRLRSCSRIGVPCHFDQARTSRSR